MSKETIMLANPYNPKYIEWPVVVTEKLDGVAADFFGKEMLQVGVQSRQGKPIKSVQHIIDWLRGKIEPGHHIICELYIPGKPFEYISGLVRQDDPAPELIAYVYDYYVEGQESMTYFNRMSLFAAGNLGELMFKQDFTGPVRFIPAMRIETEADLNTFRKKFTESKPNAEGLMVRTLTGKHTGYKFGRSWGMQKLKAVETIDLRVVGFEEALDKNGEPKGMVGRINVLYDAGASTDGNNEYTDFTTIGCGPGKLTHAERTHIWNNQKKYINKTAEIAYMPSSYDALREPRFLRWRNDKD